ncbi:MAG: undecaprenyl/decaprenyl-phosphate alpha-N-acetylglucosaminyl 1-phosphate transferase [Deltaproteobacteria bacterium]|nr:undecaprenyl/decaprenyl-phosphate alpha-N-acetylglucosaminyl 1-phosphate transferase [Deltaproteobacteria bacterium]
MTSIIVIFAVSLVLALLLSPLTGRFAKKFHLIDSPSERTVHTDPVPRAGGIAIFLSFYLPFALMFFARTTPFDLVMKEHRVVYIILGSCVIFGLGLWDDIRRLGPGAKFSIQVLAGMITYMGDIRIMAIGLPGIAPLHLGWVSLPVTIFWVVLLINAINLIDGLDGLAAGVTFFVSLLLIVLSLLDQKLLIALGLAALAGATLGFLRYNFNPASIFMGDSGSYFLGYMLAALTILGSMKSQAALTILIPMIALGVPLMDTVWATIRRFLLGQGLFRPDSDHFHHRLLRLGYTHHRVVLFLYGATIVLGLLSLTLVHAHDDRAALLLLVVGVLAVFGIRKLGYLDYLAVDKLIGWVRDVSDEAGIRRSRRTFLSHQMNISHAGNVDDLWLRLVSAGELLALDFLNLKLVDDGDADQASSDYDWDSGRGKLDVASLDSRKTLYISLPLKDSHSRMGSLVIAKHIDKSFDIPPEFFRRIEQLRRTVTQTLRVLSD